MYIVEETSGCATRFLSEITHTTKLFSPKVSYKAVNFTKYLLSGYDNSLFCSRLDKFHCHTEIVHNVNCHMQYFSKENPVKSKSYYKIDLTQNCTSKICTIYC